MTYNQRQKHRQQCLETMATAYAARAAKPPWTFDDLITAAFDSLHGIAVVNAVHATREMVAVGLQRSEDRVGLGPLWNAMSAAGDLTNPQEEPQS